MPELRNKGLLHQTYKISIFLKGLLAIAEIAGGLFLYLVNSQTIASYLSSFSQGELGEDPGDIIAQFIASFAHTFSVSGQVFASFYLLGHGVVKIFVVGALMREKIWAYQTAILIFSLFIIYQLYRYTHTHSIWLIVLSIFDLFIIYLVYREH